MLAAITFACIDFYIGANLVTNVHYVGKFIPVLYKFNINYYTYLNIYIKHKLFLKIKFYFLLWVKEKPKQVLPKMKIKQI